MRVLILISESWNDAVHPNNNLTNWFESFPGVELYVISGGPEPPSNRCCKNYFTLCDLTMFKSLLPFGKKAGKMLTFHDYPVAGESLTPAESAVYRRRNKMHHSVFRLLRDFIWRFGRIDTRLLEKFLCSAKPDLIFSIRMGSVKMCRLEKSVLKYTNAPVIAYTGDNEYHQDGLDGGLIGIMHTLWTRCWLNRMIPEYKLYYSMSRSQMDFYRGKFGVETKFLVKSGHFSQDKVHTVIHAPVRMVYAGKLYWGRADTLGTVVKTLKEICADRPPSFRLDIYTDEPLTREQYELLNDGLLSAVHHPVSADELAKIYSDADIALHIEALEGADARKTQYSFSTKIMDCLSCGCAVMAVCNPAQAGFDYLRRHDIALTATDERSLRELLLKIERQPDLLTEYAQKAYLYGRDHHTRGQTQKMLMDDFTRIVDTANEGR